MTAPDISAAILDLLLDEEETAEVIQLTGNPQLLEQLAPRYSVIQRDRLGPALERLVAQARQPSAPAGGDLSQEAQRVLGVLRASWDHHLYHQYDAFRGRESAGLVAGDAGGPVDLTVFAELERAGVLWWFSGGEDERVGERGYIAVPDAAGHARALLALWVEARGGVPASRAALLTLAAARGWSWPESLGYNDALARLLVDDRAVVEELRKIFGATT